MYKFYCYDALIQMNSKDLFKGRFGISNSAYEKVFADMQDCELFYDLILKRNQFDVCDLITPKENLDEDLKNNEELAIAVECESGYHPDDLLFITADKELAKIANKYFGTDSIKLLKDKNKQQNK